MTPSRPGLVSSIPFRITPRGGGDYGLTGTLTDIAELDASPAFGGANLQVYALSFVLNGATNNYVRNPTSCQTHNNTGQAAGYEDPTFTDGPRLPVRHHRLRHGAVQADDHAGARGRRQHRLQPPCAIQADDHAGGGSTPT